MTDRPAIVVAEPLTDVTQTPKRNRHIQSAAFNKRRELTTSQDKANGQPQ